MLVNIYDDSTGSLIEDGTEIIDITGSEEEDDVVKSAYYVNWVFGKF